MNNPNLPQTAEEWGALFTSHFNMWSVQPSAGEVLLAAVNAMPDDASEVTDQQFGEHVLRPLTNHGYNSGWVIDGTFSVDDRRVSDWMESVIDGAQEDSIEESDEEQEEVTPDQEALDLTLVTKVFADASPLFAGWFASRGEAITIQQMIDVALTQFKDWRRGKYQVSSEVRRLAQFNRRLNKATGRTIRGLSQSVNATTSMVSEALERLWLASQGKESEANERRPVHVDRAMLESALSSGLVESPAWPGLSDYYKAYAMYYATEAWRWQAEAPEFNPDFVSEVNRRVNRYVTLTVTEEDAQTVYDAMTHLWFGTALAGIEPEEGVKDADSLTTWLLDQHKDVGGLQRSAIQNGILDWIDTVRTEPDAVEKEGLTAALRRNIIAFGYTRFTGKVRRRLLEATLRQVFEAEQGAGLTDEQWRARWARRDTAISYVSGRYGEENSMCSTLERACRELGVDPTRKPKHTVRFRGSGVVVEVEVETWADSESRVMDAARTKWEQMSVEDREAAIVERTEPYVAWANMIVAR